MRNFSKRIGGAILTLAFVFGIYSAASSTAQAQWPYGNRDTSSQDRRDRDRNDDYNRSRRGRNWDRYDRWGGNAQLRQTALNAGYNEGIKEGRRDRNRRERYDFNDFKSYRNADKDYNSRLGDK